MGFLGDAIHATPPNLAQGGCQAIEDALCQRTSEATPVAAFETYARLWRPKTTFVVQTSRALGWAAHVRNLLHP